MANLEVITCHRVFRQLFFWVSSIRIFMLLCEPWRTSFPVLLMVNILMHYPRIVGLRWDVWVSWKLKLNQEWFRGYFCLDFISRLQGLSCQLVFRCFGTMSKFYYGAFFPPNDFDWRTLDALLWKISERSTGFSVTGILAVRGEYWPGPGCQFRPSSVTISLRRLTPLLAANY